MGGCLQTLPKLPESNHQDLSDKSPFKESIWVNELIAPGISFAVRDPLPSASEKLSSRSLVSDIESIPGTPETPITHAPSVQLAAVTELEDANRSITEKDSTEIPAEICYEPKDLWSRVRDNISLSGYQYQRVIQEVDWYSSHQSYLNRIAERAQPYLHLIVEEVERRKLPIELALLPIVESAYQPFAYSHGRAAGLWQIIPETGTRFGLKQNWWYDGRRDVLESTRAALDYLEYLHRLFDGDWLLALAAYNSGEGTVMRAVKKNRNKGHRTTFWSLKLPKETQAYVPKLLALTNIASNPGAYGVLLNTIEDRPFLTTVDVGSQIDLDLAAELAGISLEEIYRYNPAFNHWATDPDGIQRLLMPLSVAKAFKERLNSYPAAKRITWKRHTIKSGEVLGQLAIRYQTSVELLKKVNSLTDHRIRVGQNLLIPVARKRLDNYNLSAGQRQLKQQAKHQKGKRVTHTVKNGDTFWDIAQKYGVSSGQIAKWNGMAPRDTLSIGKKLVIWRSGSTQNHQKSSASGRSGLQKLTYTVKNGDSLALIGQRFKVTIKELRQWNQKSLHKKKYLQPGDRLVMFVDVKRQSSDG